MNYTLHQLLVFKAVAQTGSITRAAEKLHLTQPAVSIQLKNFQEQFDLPLTETVGKRLHLTDFGKQVLESADRIEEEVELIRSKMLLEKGLIIGKLNISVVSTGKYVMPYFLSDFLNLHPAIDLVMDVTNREKVMVTLERNEVDFSLVSILPARLACEFLPLMPNSLYLVGNRHSPLDAKQYTLRILKDLPLIFREPGSGTRATLEAYLLKHKIPVNMKMELTTNEAVKQAVIAGLGYAVMPIIGMRNEVVSGDLKIIPVKGFPIESRWYLVWPKGKRHSAAAAALLDYLREHYQAIIKTHFSNLKVGV